jgi:hypothetical protein
MYKKDEVKGEN